jgi:hypothetical protein
MIRNELIRPSEGNPFGAAVAQVIKVPNRVNAGCVCSIEATIGNASRLMLR